MYDPQSSRGKQEILVAEKTPVKGKQLAIYSHPLPMQLEVYGSVGPRIGYDHEHMGVIM